MNNYLQWTDPLISQWFNNYVGFPSEPQILGWTSILEGRDTLISAPTGSGKTLAAFLVCIDALVQQALAGSLNDETAVLYISPLKAVSNDVQKNLMKPLHEIYQLAELQLLSMQEIKVSVRTGDTPMKERQAMLKKPPHILVTTPESLYILLTSEKSRLFLRSVKTIIVDEIHALANSKRGSHLSLSLERLEAITFQKPIRIGLSATQKPISTIGKFLTGNARPKPNIINIGHAKHLQLTVETPKSELSAVASNNQWDEIYDRIAELTRANRSTLIFANTRRVAERTAHHLAERLGENQVLAHHGSLSRKLRLAAETKLKNGELKALVATASLELGIDIGSVDLVCQLGSPRSIAVMLQRIGRAGHWHGGISKGCIFATSRDELIECAALVYAIKKGDLDKLILPYEPKDILAQQIVASCATDDWQEDDLFQMIKRSFPYKNLSRKTFDQLLELLSEGIEGTRGRYSAYLFRDRLNGLVKARRGARLTAIMNGGAIPDNALFTVIAEPNDMTVGTLDEDFAVESNRGDVILLGSTSWSIRRIESGTGRVIVEDAHGAPPSVPFWIGEAPARTDELSLHVSRLRQTISDSLSITYSPTEDLAQHPDAQKTIHWLKQECQLNDYGAQQAIDYILQGRTLLGAIPTQQTLIAERFFDESGGMQLVIHSPFGARINKAWGLALRKCFCRAFNFELQAAATDNGLNIALTEQHSFPLMDVFRFLHVNSITEILIQAVLQSPLFATRWRWVAGRALALIRYRNGKKIPPNILRMRAEDLLAAVFPQANACQDNLQGDISLPDHLFINEAMHDCLNEGLDLHGLIKLLSNIQQQKITCLALDTPTPSVFAHEILNANPYAFLDDAPLEERRTRAVEMRRILPKNLLENLAKLDPEAINLVKEQAWPDVRTKDELHDALNSFIAFPIDTQELQKYRPQWEYYFNELLHLGRAGTAQIKGQLFWYSIDRAKTFTHIYPEAQIIQPVQEIEQKALDYDEGIQTLIRNWLLCLGPISSQKLSDLLAIKLNHVEQALLHIEATGLILRGSFSGMHSQEWCERRLLARIHQLTLGRLRKEIEPISATLFLRWLMHWQHLDSKTHLAGDAGLLTIIEQLQGFELPAKIWERDIFAKRLIHYDPQSLDKLCLMGIVGWGRISPVNKGEEKEIKRVIPTSIASMTFFIRDNCTWLANSHEFDHKKACVQLSARAEDIASYLQTQGASFLTDIVQGVSGLKSEVELGLWELVSAGLATADAFDNLRSIIDPKRRLLNKRRRSVQALYSTGRWSLLKPLAIKEHSKQIEACCWLLLKRYGVIFRDLLAREKNMPAWRDLLIGLRRLEDRGEIRGGYFVAGFLGEQFALPNAIDSLRAMKTKPLDQEVVMMSAVDPLNVIGTITPGKKIPTLSSGRVKIQNGIVIE